MSVTQASSEAPVEAPVQTSSTRRVLAASLAGTAIEYYDFFIYSTAASLVLGPLFFPAASPTAQLFSAYASFAVAFLARPVGAALFGHFGDRIGRKSTLVAALMTMGLSTVLIGLLPGYAHLGWLAPALLCILRFGQGLGLGGEWGGAALLAVENAPPGWRGRFGIFPQLGIPVGLIAANGVFLILGLQLTPDQFKAWGWRAPFVLSALLVALGLWVRLKLSETPAFQAAMAKGPPPSAPLGELVRRHFPPLLAGGVAVIGVFAIFYLATAFTLGYGVSELHYDREALLGVQLGAFVLMGLGMLIAGWWCDKASPRLVMMAGYVALFVTGLLLPRLMTEGSLVRFGGFMAASLFLMGFISGPLGALLPSLFPTRVRYTGSSIAFTAGGILGGGIAPMAATALAAEGGLLPVSLYFSGAALLSFLALLLLGRPKADDRTDAPGRPRLTCRRIDSMRSAEFRGGRAMSESRTAPGAPSNRRVLIASLVGTAVEFYDFYIYATAASLVLGPLFFPAASPSAQLLSSYATFAVAFFARPLGAAFFGHFGDRIGRKSTLVASLMTMGGSTVLIGLLPGYDQIGWLAPVLLCVLRFGQGFGLGGEWGGAALLAVENAPPGWRARFGMFPQLGAPVGFIAANGLFLLLGLLLTPEQFKAWGWRLPFIASAVLVALGLWVRLKLTETPAFKAALAEAPPAHAPLGEVLTKHWLATLGGTFAVVACFAIFYLTTAFALGYGVGPLGYSREVFLGVQLGAILFLAAGIVAAGYWSDASSPRRVLMAGCVATVAAGFLLPVMMGSGSLLLIWAFLSLALFLMGLVYGPLGAFLPSLFPTRVRYSGSSVAFNVGGIVGGGLAPMIAAALAAKGGLPPVGLYLAGAALISLAALVPLSRRTQHDLG